MLAGMWGKGNPIHSWWECKMVQPLWKSVLGVSQSEKKKSYYMTSVPILGRQLKDSILLQSAVY